MRAKPDKQGKLRILKDFPPRRLTNFWAIGEVVYKI
jgi:hypothetical protein